MTIIQIGAVCYLATGSVRSYFLTRYYHRLVERPAGGRSRLVAVYLIITIFWLPIEVLRTLAKLIPHDTEEP